MIRQKNDSQQWYTCDIPRKELKSFMQRNDHHVIFYVGFWFLMLIICGIFASLIYPSPWSIPVFLFYGIIYCGCDARWHECSHGTAFRTRWLNEIVHFIASAMQQRDIVFNRYRHARHHSFTQMRDYDYEIVVSKPPRLILLMTNAFNLPGGINHIKTLILHSLGIVTRPAKDLVPEEDYKQMFFWARMSLLTNTVALGLAIGLQSWLPVLLWALPRFYGNFILWMFVLAQHGGLAEDVWDHRLNTRTIIVNPILAYLYMNMQYHLEHHIYPAIPFHGLPKLHAKVKDQLPEAYHGMFAVYKEMIPALLKMRKDPGCYIHRQYPETVAV